MWAIMVTAIAVAAIASACLFFHGATWVEDMEKEGSFDWEDDDDSKPRS